MTQREFYDAVLIEINQYGSPDFLLEDFIYWGNKAIDNYVKKRYNVYDVNQQVSDDLVELKGFVTFTPIITRDSNGNVSAITATMTGDETKPNVPATSNNYGIVLELPDKYYHLTDAIVTYDVKTDWKCKGYHKGEQFSIKSDRLPAGQFSMVQSLPFYRPNHRRPYHTILNSEGKSVPKMMITAGNITPTFEFSRIDIIYIKLPSKLSLSETQINTTTDTSEEMEFSDPQAKEIVKECVTLLLATFGDPRIQSKPMVDQAVAQPQGPDTQLSR